MQNATFTAVRDHRAGDPVDIETIKQAAGDVIRDGAKITEPDELITIILLLKGAIRLLIPEVEMRSARRPRQDDVPAVCARACIGEATMRLRIGYGDNMAVRLSVAQKMARTTIALCDHYVNLAE